MNTLFLLIFLLFNTYTSQYIKPLPQRDFAISHYYNDLDTKIYIICSKYEALHLYNDVKGTIIQEIGIQNYYTTAKHRMSIVSYTNDIGTCQFQPRTYEWLSKRYGINTNVIDPESSQITVMVLAFKDGKQNLWYGYKKYKIYENK